MVKKWIFIFLFMTIAPLFGYEFSSDISQGMYWASFPLKMQVVVPTNDGGQLLRIVKECEVEWESQLGLDIWDIRVANGSDKNTIYWEDNFGAVTGYNPNQTLALTMRYQTGGFFTKIQIILNGSMNVLRQNWSGLLKKTLLHEMGHTIGLDHSTEPAIMQALIGAYDHLEADDIRGGNAVIDEQRHRQAIGYISPLATEDQKLVSCGTVDFSGGSGSGSGSGGPLSLSFVFSLLLGIAPLLLITREGRKNFLPLSNG